MAHKFRPNWPDGQQPPMVEEKRGKVSKVKRLANSWQGNAKKENNCNWLFWSLDLQNGRRKMNIPSADPLIPIGMPIIPCLPSLSDFPSCLIPRCQKAAAAKMQFGSGPIPPQLWHWLWLWPLAPNLAAKTIQRRNLDWTGGTRWTSSLSPLCCSAEGVASFKRRFGPRRAQIGFENARKLPRGQQQWAEDCEQNIPPPLSLNISFSKFPCLSTYEYFASHRWRVASLPSRC
jgi:hypothetical protein